MNILSDGAVKTVFGALLGTQEGNNIEVKYSFEFYNQSEDGLVDLDVHFIEDRKRLSEQLFPNYELLGYYSTGETSEPTEEGALINIMESHGIVNPINLVFNINIFDVEELPLTVYEYSRQRNSYQKLEHEVEAFDSERISLDTVIKQKDVSNKNSVISENMLTMKNAISVLKSNLVSIRNAVERGNHRALSKVNELIINYPEALKKDENKLITNAYNEILILGNLCSCSSTHSYIGRLGEQKNKDY